MEVWICQRAENLKKEDKNRSDKVTCFDASIIFNANTTGFSRLRFKVSVNFYSTAYGFTKTGILCCIKMIYTRRPMYVCMYVCMHVCMHVCNYVCTCMHA